MHLSIYKCDKELWGTISVGPYPSSRDLMPSLYSALPNIIVPRTGIQYMYLSENVADLSAMLSRSSQVQSNCSYCMGARASYWLCIIWSYPSMGANGDCPWLLCNEGAIKSS
jgi:hypothetical protein